MGRKTLGFGILGVILIAVIYYFNHTEHVKNLNTLKEALHGQLTQMQNNGFTLSNRVLEKESEYFVIQINDPKKAALFLRGKGLQVTAEEAEDLMGVQVATDVSYVKDTIALDSYPLTLPTALTDAVVSEDDKKILAQIQEMIKKKTFFIHIDIVPSNTTYSGYIKDIDESIVGEKEIKLTLQGLQFSGELKDDKIVKYMQRYNTLHLYASNEINRTITNYQSYYALTGTTVYDYTTDYNIGEMKISEEAEGTLFADTIVLHSSSTVKDGMGRETLQTKIQNLDLLFEKEKFGMKSLVLDMNISNIHIDTLEKLQNKDQNKEKVSDLPLKTLGSNNMHLDIVNLSVDRVILQGKEMNGFSLDAKLELDESLDIYRLGMKPGHALKKMGGEINLSISKEILELLKKDPKFMLTYMMYRPKRVKEQRIYKIQMDNGDYKINGKAVDF